MENVATNVLSIKASKVTFSIVDVGNSQKPSRKATMLVFCASVPAGPEVYQMPDNLRCFGLSQVSIVSGRRVPYAFFAPTKRELKDFRCARLRAAQRFPEYAVNAEVFARDFPDAWTELS